MNKEILLSYDLIHMDIIKFNDWSDITEFKQILMTIRAFLINNSIKFNNMKGRDLIVVRRNVT